ncbi:type 1 glutamine amidotransferase [Haloplanus sp. C73]|uniref:type 1 glutamine amidotransferase n=1 Tax=Haloplanus sp. C73 TaxID=3421641 RepID=UPI003EB85DE7
MLRFALLDASHGTEHTRRNFRRELDAALVEFDVSAGDLPPDFDYDAVVVTGSRSSVYGSEPWIDDLLDWIGSAADRGLPILGVCYGHQALAAALGGQVESMGDYELGYREVRTVDDDPLFAGIDTPFTAFQAHSDRVTALPPGATRLAENDRGVQAFRRGNCWGVQFHPEYDQSSAEEVARGTDLPADRIQRVVDGIDDDAYDAACRTKRLFDNFVEHVRRHTVDEPPA